MSPPFLQRCIFNSPLLPSSRLVQVSPQCRQVSTRRHTPKTVLVQLTKNVPKLGQRGDVVVVKGSRMRNTLHPYSMAQYIHPGSNTFLTQNKLAIPVGPNYRRILRKNQPDPLRIEFKTLFQKAKARLEQEDAERPARNAGENVLLQIEQYKRRIQKDDKWSKQEKSELLKFLSVQASSWGMVGDGLGSANVRRAKETMLLETWRKFTAGIHQSDGRAVNDVDHGLEEEPSTSGTIIQGDIKTLTDGIETPVGTDTPIGQTVSHEGETAELK